MIETRVEESCLEHNCGNFCGCGCICHDADVAEGITRHQSCAECYQVLRSQLAERTRELEDAKKRNDGLHKAAHEYKVERDRCLAAESKILAKVDAQQERAEKAEARVEESRLGRQARKEQVDAAFAEADKWKAALALSRAEAVRLRGALESVRDCNADEPCPACTATARDLLASPSSSAALDSIRLAQEVLCEVDAAAVHAYDCPGATVRDACTCFISKLKSALSALTEQFLGSKS